MNKHLTNMDGLGFSRGLKLRSVLRSGGLMLAVVTFSLPASAQDAGPVVVQPGAPGQPTHTLPSTTRATLPPASQLAAESYGPGNNFFGFTVGLSGMLYNTGAVQASQVPTTWTGLLDPKWKNKLVMYDPTAIGEMDDIFAHLALVPGDTGMMTGLKAQNPQLSPSSDITGPLTAVAQGAKSLGIGVPYAFYLVAKAQGAPVKQATVNAAAAAAAAPKK